MSYGGSSGSSRIATASDAALSNPQNGQALTYSSASQKWVNTTLSAGAPIGASRDAVTGWYHADGYNVLPSNTAAQNTTNLQALLNAIPAAYGSGNSIGGTVFVPEGRYHFSGQVTVPMGVKIIGNAGSRSSNQGWWDAIGTAFICDTSGMTLLNLNANGVSGTLSQAGATIEAISFFGQNAGFDCRFIYAPNVNRWTVRDCSFTWGSIGIEGDATSNSGGDCSWWSIENSTFSSCATGIKCTAASGNVFGGDMTGCTIGADIYGVSGPMRMTGMKFDVADGCIGLQARSENSTYTALHFEIFGAGTGIIVDQDPAVSYSGGNNVFMGCGFYGHASNSLALKINSGASSTRVIAPILATSSGYQIQDSGSGTVRIGG